jgi:predicted nucleic acid-binding protein
MNVANSCAWLEYFADGPNADFFAPAIEATEELVVPSLTIFEVFKRVLQQRNEATARQHGALLWTQDAHFDGMDGVHYMRKAT